MDLCFTESKAPQTMIQSFGTVQSNFVVHLSVILMTGVVEELDWPAIFLAPVKCIIIIINYKMAPKCQIKPSTLFRTPAESLVHSDELISLLSYNNYFK